MKSRVTWSILVEIKWGVGCETDTERGAGGPFSLRFNIKEMPQIKKLLNVVSSKLSRYTLILFIFVDHDPCTRLCPTNTTHTYVRYNTTPLYR